jgi:hypothetical protein
MERIFATACAAAVLVAVVSACNTSGLSNAPRATFAQLACLDVDDDGRLSDADAAQPSELPDFNADDSRDDEDAAFLRGVDIALDPDRDRAGCEGDDDTPEYLVAHGYFEPSDVSCEGDRAAVLLLGIGGGAVNVREKEDAAGMRSLVDALMEAYDDRDAQTIGVIAGPAINGATQPHGAMEQWLSNAVSVYLERYPCLRVVVAGHSHGAVTADVVGATLEDRYADRIVSVVIVDRIDQLYGGDTSSRPVQAHVLNVYETNDDTFSGAPYDSPNAENIDVTGETGPEHGEEGGEQQPVTHTTIDNSGDVREIIVDRLMERSEEFAAGG